MEQKISVVVAPLIVNEKSEILLVKSQKWKGWVMPGGHVEFRETLIEAVIREAKEETNLDIEPKGIINSGDTINPSTFYKKAHFIYFHFLARLKSKNIRLDPKELTDHKWFSAQDALKECDPRIQPTIKKYLANLK